MAFITVNRSNPCPICKKPDWCGVSEDQDVVMCRRTNNGDTKIDQSGLEYWLYKIQDSGKNTAQKVARDLSKTSIPAGSYELRDSVYREILDFFRLEDEHRSDLFKRGLSDADIKKRGYKSLPRKRLGVFKRLEEKGFSEQQLLSVPGIFKRENGQWGIAGPSGLLIPARDAAGRIIAFKIRVYEDSQERKYIWLSSSKYGGPGPGVVIHFPTPVGDSWNFDDVIITEGELKADISSAILGRPVISIPGVSTWRQILPVLREIGTSSVQLAWDADAKTNDMVAKTLDSAARAMAYEGYSVSILEWDQSIGKGLDDVIAAGRNSDIVMVPFDNSRLLEMAESGDIPITDFGKKTDLLASSPFLRALVGADGEDRPVDKEEFDEIIAKTKEDPGYILEEDILKRIAVMRKSGPDWVRLKVEISKIKGIGIRDIERAVRPFMQKAVVPPSPPSIQEIDMIDLDGDAETEPPADPPDDEKGMRSDSPEEWPRVRINEEVVVWRNGSYYRELSRISQETGERYVYDYAPISNWSIKITRIVSNSDTNDVVYEGSVLLNEGSRRKRITFTDEDLSENKKFELVLRKVQSRGIFIAPKCEKLIINAMLYFNMGAPQIYGTTAPGYVDSDTFVTPSVIIRNGEIAPNTNMPCILTGDFLGRYDLAIGTDEEALEASKLLIDKVVEFHVHEVTLPLLSAMVASPVISRARWQRFSLYLEGDFQSGKTITCKAFLNLFENAPLTAPGGLLNVTSTVNALQYDLYMLRDQAAVIDDIKLETINLQQFFRLLQGIYDGTGRRRMTSSMKQQTEYYARAQVILTGEEIPTSVASAVSRTLVLNVPNVTNKNGIPDKYWIDKRERLVREIGEGRTKLPILMARYIAWTQKQNIRDIANFDAIEFKLRGNRTEIFCRQMLASIRAFFMFLADEFEYWADNSDVLDALFDEARTAFYKVAQYTIMRTEAERKEDNFMAGLRALVQSGRATIGPSGMPGTPTIGIPFMETDENGNNNVYVDVIAQMAVSMVSNMTGQKYAISTLAQRLRQYGFVEDDDGRPSRQKRVEGNRLYVWRMKASWLLDDAEVTRLVDTMSRL